MSGKIILPAGVYYIGDPLYVLDKNEWFDRVYSSVNIYDPDKRIWHHKTDGGDGVFYDQYDNEYGVDSASIGVVHVDTMVKRTTRKVSGEELGAMHKFENEFMCEYEDGVFTIGHVVIDTAAEWR